MTDVTDELLAGLLEDTHVETEPVVFGYRYVLFFGSEPRAVIASNRKLPDVRRQYPFNRVVPLDRLRSSSL